MLVPANALRTDAGPSRPAAGPEAVFVTRGEGVSSSPTPRTTTPGTAIGECDRMCCSCHMYGYLWYTNLRLDATWGERHPDVGTSSITDRDRGNSAEIVS